jgi:hypothetical protein
LQESLDPEAAAKAIEAVDKTLEKPRASQVDRTNFPPIIPSQRRIRTYRRAADSTQQTKLPSIAIYAYDNDRESIRSTRSEPIQGTKMIFTPEKRPPSHREPRRPSKISLINNDYNASGVLDVLRLQKQQESRRAKPDFSGMWKWKEKLDNKSEESGERTKQFKKSSSIDNKVSQVKKMHELYRNNASLPPNDSLSSLELNSGVSSPKSPSRNMQLSPIRHRSQQQHSPYQKPQTPVVKDKDLTTDDYQTVSKYFKLHSPVPSSSRFQQSKILPPALLPLISSPVHTSHSPSPSPPPDDLAQEDQTDGYSVNGQFTISADQSLIQPNSPDGLLNWCATLNTDFIDDLY